MNTSNKKLSATFVKLILGILSVGSLAIPQLPTTQADAPRLQLQPLRFQNVLDSLSPSFENQGFSFMPGVGFIDYDNDSYLDIYAVTGKDHPNALFRNNQDGTFTNVAAQAGVADLGQGTGVAVGDINNDGFDDLYVANGTTIGDGLDSNDGPDRLYINNGNGTFNDITMQAGIREDGFNTSVALFDYDGDGDLDLIVGSWVDFDFNPASAGRDEVPGKSSHLYRNNGNLTFTDVTATSGFGNSAYNTWAIACFDYDGDLDQDVFLGYERGPIDVFRNNGNGTFTKVTDKSGDLNAYGAWMGLAIGDYDRDGNFDIFSSNISDLRITRDPSLPPLVVPPPSTWDNPRPTLFHNNGDGTFTDVGREAINSQFEQFSWGCVFADFDNDGWPDIYNAMNLAPVGVVGREREGAGPGRLHINNHNGTFTDTTFATGIANLSSDGKYLDGRGVAIADFNKDGNVDIFLQNVPQFVEGFPFGKTIIPGKGKPKVFKNLGTGANWVELRLIGTGSSNRNAVGAKVTITTKSGKQYGLVAGGTTIYGASSRIVHFGLGTDRNPEVEIKWPDGKVQTFRRIPANKISTIFEGRDQRVSESAFQAAGAR
jgi:hypothetical protein